MFTFLPSDLYIITQVYPVKIFICNDSDSTKIFKVIEYGFFPFIDFTIYQEYGAILCSENINLFWNGYLS